MAETKQTPEDILAKEAKKILASGGWDEGPKLHDPEWFILYGATRTGKSYQAYNLFNHAYTCAMFEGKEGPQLPRMYVLDLDSSAHRDLQCYPDLMANKAVKIRRCADVADVMVATCALVGDEKNKIPNLIRPGDWLMVDRATVVWEGMPDYWCRTRLLKTVDQLEFEHQTSMGEGRIKGGNAILEYYRAGINPLWFNWEQSLRLSGAHCILVCTDQELQLEKNAVRGKDSPEKIGAFNHIGFVPRMQGDTWSRWHTQLHFSRPFMTPDYFVRTAGDRGTRTFLGPGQQGGRQRLQRSVEEGLGQIYLGNVAGWGQ